MLSSTVMATSKRKALIALALAELGFAASGLYLLIQDIRLDPVEKARRRRQEQAALLDRIYGTNA